MDLGMLQKKDESSEAPGAYIARILNECQHSYGLHSRRVKELAAWRLDHKDSFMKEWWTCLVPIFTVFKREPSVERIVKFVAAFAAYRDEEHGNECNTFLEEFFGILLYSSDASNKAVRLRACQLISEVMMRLEENAEVSDEVWDEVIDCMQRRMKDKIPSVRVFAARALARFANADNSGDFKNDPIVTDYRQVLQFDQHADVRKTVILSMPPSNDTAVDIVKHTSDVSYAVRKAAFTVLRNKFPIQSLSIKQRTTVLRQGLHDRIPSVQTECSNMLKEAWLGKCCHGDCITLLKLLDVETHESVCESVMLALLEGGLISLQNGQGVRGFCNIGEDSEKGDYGNLTLMEAENALYWRMVCNHLHSEAQAKGHDAATTAGTEAAVNAEAAAEKSELLERILPATVADYVELVKAHLSAGPNYCFVSRQLLLLGKFLDFSDATNRKVASELLENLLRMPAEHGHLDSGEDKEVLVGDGLHLGGDRDWAIAVIEFAWTVYGAPGEFEEAVAEAVAELGKPCREGGANIMQWINCLALTGLLLENIESLHQLSGLAIEGNEILNGLLLPAAKHIHHEVQRAAQKCLGVFCLRENKPSLQVVRQLRFGVRNSFPSVRKMAIKALFDLSMWHGAAVIDKAIGIGSDLGQIPMTIDPGLQVPGVASTISVEVDENEEEGSNHLPTLQLLALRLDDDNDLEDQVQERVTDGGDEKETIKSIAVEGFAKLLLQSKVFSDILQLQHTILGKLLPLYFREETKTFPRLMQCLSVFFDTYPAVALDHKKCISKVFVPVIRSEWPGIYENQVSSPAMAAAKKRNALQLSRFMLQLLHQPMLKTQEHSTDPHSRADNEANSSEQEVGSIDRKAKVEVMGDELAIRIAAEIAGFPSKRSAAGKSYIAMLTKIMVSLDLRTSEQQTIKCMQKLLDCMMNSMGTDKQVVKELENMLMRLKALDTTPEEGLSDEQFQIILSDMEIENFKLGPPTPKAISTPAPTPRRGTSKKRVKKPTTPDSASPVYFTPVVPCTVRSMRASKTAALGKMRSELAASKRAIYASSDEKISSSPSSSSDEQDGTDSEFEVEKEQDKESASAPVEKGSMSLQKTVNTATHDHQIPILKETDSPNKPFEDFAQPADTDCLSATGSLEGDENLGVSTTSEGTANKRRGRAGRKNLAPNSEGFKSGRFGKKIQDSEQSSLTTDPNNTADAKCVTSVEHTGRRTAAKTASKTLSARRSERLTRASVPCSVVQD